MAENPITGLDTSRVKEDFARSGPRAATLLLLLLPSLLLGTADAEQHRSVALLHAETGSHHAKLMQLGGV